MSLATVIKDLTKLFLKYLRELMIFIFKDKNDISFYFTYLFFLEIIVGTSLTNCRIYRQALAILQFSQKMYRKFLNSGSITFSHIFSSPGRYNCSFFFKLVTIIRYIHIKTKIQSSIFITPNESVDSNLKR